MAIAKIAYILYITFLRGVHFLSPQFPSEHHALFTGTSSKTEKGSLEVNQPTILKTFITALV